MPFKAFTLPIARGDNKLRLTRRAPCSYVYMSRHTPDLPRSWHSSRAQQARRLSLSASKRRMKMTWANLARLLYSEVDISRN